MLVALLVVTAYSAYATYLLWIHVWRSKKEVVATIDLHGGETILVNGERYLVGTSFTDKDIHLVYAEKAFSEIEADEKKKRPR